MRSAGSIISQLDYFDLAIDFGYRQIPALEITHFKIKACS